MRVEEVCRESLLLGLQSEHPLSEVERKVLEGLVVMALLQEQSAAVGQKVLDLDDHAQSPCPARDVDVLDALDRALESRLKHWQRLEEGDRVGL